MSDPTILGNKVNALLISVNGEKSTAGDNWYSVDDWTTYRIDPSSLPAAIQDGFATLMQQGTAGVPATGRNDSGSEIRLYLINISALNNSHPSPGEPGAPIRDFTTTLANQTILLRGIDSGGADIYSHITQADWSAQSFPPARFAAGIPGIVDGLITNSDLAVRFDPKLAARINPPPPDFVITCYLLNLASFTDP